MALFGLEHEVQRKPVLAGGDGELADHRDHQALAVHVGALHLDLAQLAGAHLAELLELVLVVAPVVRGRPGGLGELVLLVADELGERGVELLELAVEGEDGHRGGDVVEAVARLAPHRLALPGGRRRGWRLPGSAFMESDAAESRRGRPGALRAAAMPRICWKTSVTRSVEPSPALCAALRACSASRRAITAAWPAELRPCLSSSRLASANASSDCITSTRWSAWLRAVSATARTLASSERSSSRVRASSSRSALTPWPAASATSRTWAISVRSAAARSSAARRASSAATTLSPSRSTRPSRTSRRSRPAVGSPLSAAVRCSTAPRRSTAPSAVERAPATVS